MRGAPATWHARVLTTPTLAAAVAGALVASASLTLLALSLSELHGVRERLERTDGKIAALRSELAGTAREAPPLLRQARSLLTEAGPSLSELRRDLRRTRGALSGLAGQVGPLVVELQRAGVTSLVARAGDLLAGLERLGLGRQASLLVDTASRSLATLPEIRRDIAAVPAMSADVAALPLALRRLERELRSLEPQLRRLGGLQRSLDQTVAILAEMNVHIRSLDRKAGGPLLGCGARC